MCLCLCGPPFIPLHTSEWPFYQRLWYFPKAKFFLGHPVWTKFIVPLLTYSTDCFVFPLFSYKTLLISNEIWIFGFWPLLLKSWSDFFWDTLEAPNLNIKYEFTKIWGLSDQSGRLQSNNASGGVIMNPPPLCKVGFNLHQINYVGDVLESSSQAYSKIGFGFHFHHD